METSVTGTEITLIRIIIINNQGRVNRFIVCSEQAQ
jgi:hypothetical protein